MIQHTHSGQPATSRGRAVLSQAVSAATRLPGRTDMTSSLSTMGRLDPF